jgi:manganese/iron transport system substrate-binding protein
MRQRNSLLLSLLLIMILLSACTASPLTPAAEGQLRVVATTSILADVVSQVGGDYISLTTLVPVGANEHEYQPAPRDIAAITDADIVFQVGFGLEEFMDKVIANSGTNAALVTVSDGITPRELSAEPGHQTGEDTGDLHSTDPHVWMDPVNVVIWTNAIAASLAAADPAHQSEFLRNAEDYITQLNQLDAWIMQQVSTVPAANRKLVTDHMLLGYFAGKYGFEMVGAVIPSYSSAAQPSAQELAALEDAIRQYAVQAILVGNTVNPTLAERVAADTGISLVSFYTGSLSPADGPAATYIEYMRYNVTAIVTALGK